MSGFPAIPATSAQVKLLKDPDLSVLEGLVNTFLKGAGTPQVLSNWRVTAIQFLFDGTDYVAAITYTGN